MMQKRERESERERESQREGEQKEKKTEEIRQKYRTVVLKMNSRVRNM
jgi:hypothetical protein